MPSKICGSKQKPVCLPVSYKRPFLRDCPASIHLKANAVFWPARRERASLGGMIAWRVARSALGLGLGAESTPRHGAPSMLRPRGWGYDPRRSARRRALSMRRLALTLGHVTNAGPETFDPSPALAQRRAPVVPSQTRVAPFLPPHGLFCRGLCRAAFGSSCNEQKRSGAGSNAARTIRASSWPFALVLKPQVRLRLRYHLRTGGVTVVSSYRKHSARLSTD